MDFIYRIFSHLLSVYSTPVTTQAELVVDTILCVRICVTQTKIWFLVKNEPVSTIVKKKKVPLEHLNKVAAVCQKWMPSVLRIRFDKQMCLNICILCDNSSSRPLVSNLAFNLHAFVWICWHLIQNAILFTLKQRLCYFVSKMDLNCVAHLFW